MRPTTVALASSTRWRDLFHRKPYRNPNTIMIHPIPRAQEDEKRILTPLGRQQAALTGQRLAELLEGDVPIASIRVSTMTRAKETAEIIATYLPGLELSEPDPLLSEGRPCHHIPGGKASPKTIQMTDENHPRIESAFQKYFHRADYDPESSERHEVEIIVCHGTSLAAVGLLSVLRSLTPTLPLLCRCSLYCSKCNQIFFVSGVAIATGGLVALLPL
jgi:broad specificity phosphatase PhoE